MAGQSTSTLSALLRPNVQTTLVDLQFRKTDFFDVLRQNGRIMDNTGPAPISWNLVTGTNGSAEVFTEGEAPPAAGKQTYQQTSLLPFYVRGVAGETGHVRDNRAKGGYYTDPFDAERMLVQADVFYKTETTLMGSTQDQGIASIVSDSGTYANVSQSSISSHASYVQSSVGTLTVNSLQTTWTNLTNGIVSSIPRGANPTHVLMPANQIQNYANTIGPGATTSLFRIQAGQQFDAGVISGQMSFQGLPIVRCRAMTATEVYMIDITDWSLLIHRDLQVDPILGNPEVESYQVSVAFLPRCEHRNWQGKMTGVTQ